MVQAGHAGIADEPGGVADHGDIVGDHRSADVAVAVDLHGTLRGGRFHSGNDDITYTAIFSPCATDDLDNENFPRPGVIGNLHT
jgi:hypothetical protein